ncbi:uncharacterized protein LOC143035130 [Oratosquilla oratoria]|uniref:uncharacterized protein LOC143035130 n=1 Tax=Oratosquilla oratoria TaxID=337810 RepID=UPI003F763F46
MAFKFSKIYALFLVLVLVFESRARVKTIGVVEERGHCIAEEDLDQVACCDTAIYVEKTFIRTDEEVQSLEKQLNKSKVAMRETLDNVSVQHHLKSRENQASGFGKDFEAFVKEIAVTMQEIESLGLKNKEYFDFISRSEKKLDILIKDLEKLKKSEEYFQGVIQRSISTPSNFAQEQDEFAQIPDAFAQLSDVMPSQTLDEEVFNTETNLGILRTSLEKLEEEISNTNKKMTTAESNLQEFATVVDSLCLPPFAWQGSLCSYVPFLRKTWNESRSFCQDLGADLAVPRDYTHFIHWLSSFQFDNDVWIGASDIAKEGRWFWIDGKPLDIDVNEFFNWNEPTKKENEDCLEICSHSGFQPTDMSCEDENYFVCQKIIKTN